MWIHAARPKTLIVSVSAVFIGAAISLGDGFFDFTTFLFTLLTVLGIQIGTNFANDYFDFFKGADTIERKGPIRIIQAGLVSPKAMKIAMVLIFSLSVICGSYLVWQGGFWIGVLLAVSIFLGVLYTYGPLSLAYLGLGDLFVFVFFGPVAVCGTYYLQTHVISIEALIAGIGPGALSTAILVINNLRDIEEDRPAGKKTLAVRFGKNFAKGEFISLLLLASFVPMYFYETHPLCVAADLILFPAFSLMLSVCKITDPLQLNTLFAKTARLLGIYTLLFSLGWMINY